MPFSYRETPIVEIREDFTEKMGVRLYIKREDLNHPEIAGNKWWKLKCNIEEAYNSNCDTLLTFGGAYSNHIYSTAAAAFENGFQSIGIIRGEETLPLNHTLSFAKSKNMQLHYVSRENYRRKNERSFINELKNRFGHFYLIPEGGTNELAVKGCEEFGKKILDQIYFDYVCMPVGTGGTIAGVVNAMNGKKKVVGFSSLKGEGFLEEVVERYVGKGNDSWKLNSAYHFGGYAKTTRQLEEFIKEQKIRHDLPLDRVYTSKMLFGIYEEIRKGNFERGSVILAIHTGGMQGGY